LRTAGILVRPHPERVSEWEKVTLDRRGQVAVRGRNPISDESRAEYYDSLFHSRAVIGLVTSAFLEAAVVGKPVFTLQLDHFRLHQEGAPHFRYLVGEDGLLHASRSWDEHLAQLATVFDDSEAAATLSRRFVGRFVRPFGIGEAATPRFVSAVEALAAAPRPAPVVYGAWPARAGAEAVALMLRIPGLRGLLLSDRTVAEETSSRERADRDGAVKVRLRAEIRARVNAKEQVKAARLLEKAETRARKERAKAVREAARAVELGENRGRIIRRIKALMVTRR